MSRPGHRREGNGAAPSGRRLALAFVLGVVLVGVALAAVLKAVAPPAAPEAAVPGAPLAPRLASRVALVIVDGLRYDVGTDPELMPHFAAAMRERASGEIWAGQVSMTSSAILAIGTGQPGRLEHVIHNVDAEPPPFDTWLSSATARGLRIGVVGDRTWVDLYGRDIWQSRLDPDGVAIDVDFNPRAFAGARELARLAPDVLILHFGTPDHQGHAYGIKSRQYRAHIRRFDDDLAAFLGELPATVTVLVTSDHGAADSGTHGADVAIQRRSPIYAYGPGIRDGAKLTEPADQLDLAATLAVLVGVPPPAHDTGFLLPFLDLPDGARAGVACAHAAHVLSYAALAAGEAAVARARADLDGCAASRPPAIRLASSEHAVREAAAAVHATTGLASSGMRLWLAAILALAVIVVTLLLPGLRPRELGAALGVLAVTNALVYGVERLPGAGPNAVRAVLFVLLNAFLLALLLVPSEVAAWLTRRRAIAIALCPMTLVVSYPANTQPEAYAVAAVLAVVLVGYGALGPGLRRFFRGFDARAGRASLLALALALVVLLPAGLRPSGTYTGILPSPLVAVGLASAALAWLGWRAGLSRGAVVALAAAGALVLLARPSAGPLTGRAAWLGLTAACVWLAVRGAPRLAVLAGALAVLTVVRDFEAIPLFGVLVVADVLGAAVRAHRDATSSPEDPFVQDLLLVAAHFSLAYLFRIGAQDGLEFGGMYWGAGAFNDPQVSSFVVGSALSYKYGMGVLLVGLALRDAWRPGRAELGARAVAACYFLRALSLSGMFLLSGSSYWTALRVLGDLPTAFACAVGGLCYVLLERAASTPVEDFPPRSASSRVFTAGHSVSRMLK